MLKLDIDYKTPYEELNEKIRAASDKHIQINNCVGQRYIAAGLSGKEIDIEGIPGNALGAYLDNSVIRVQGNVQDATGDTMNAGEIVVYGCAGDATGYAMRGGKIYIRGNTGYRAGIHMKAYKSQQPVIVIGGEAGSFLGEYQAGGIIIVLGLDLPKKLDGRDYAGHPYKRPDVGDFLGTGMHGGKIYIRLHGNEEPDVPEYIVKERSKGTDISEIKEHIEHFCSFFDDVELNTLLESDFVILSPNPEKPYKQIYCAN
ncbi:MAG: glutamate synthase [Treponema sp.]|nr:glutamate synthase [Treponema sp.]